MKIIISFVVVMMSLSVFLTVFAQETDRKERNDPFACLGKADALSKGMVSEVYSTIERLKALESKEANSLCVIAELMKRVGDYRAEEYYEKAIKADKTEPAYELFYADYLRNFRGVAQHSLFPEAEEHYYDALKKLRKCKGTGGWQDFDNITEEWVERGIVTLYQEDGFPLLHWKSNIVDSGSFFERPFVFFSTINNYAKSTTDFDEVDDVRDFTSEALFTSSAIRLNRDLTEDELKKIIRLKKQFETLNRLRFRYGDLPALDIFYRYRKLEDAQITNFFEPNRFNDVNLNEYGIAIEKPFNVSPYFDFFLRGIYKRTEREGTIEFLPNKIENINHYEAKAAISRFFGPDKANLEFTYLFQDIDPDIPNPPQRDRQIFATTLTYQIFRSTSQQVYKQRFVTRGVDMFGGVIYDKESFEDVDVKKNDFFIGISFKGLGDFDITVQPTFFISEVEGDDCRNNSQYRTNLTLLYRILDEEREKGIPKEKFMGIPVSFLHLVIPFRHDVAIDGLKDFENFKIGIELDGKLFSTGIRRTTYLFSARYDYQRFYRLDNDLNLFSFNISMGF